MRARPLRPRLFKWRQFDAEVIVCPVRWHPRYSRTYTEAQELLRAIRHGAPPPRVIDSDLAATHPTAIARLQRSGDLPRRCRHQPVQYLNNLVEQDHRKRRCRYVNNVVEQGHQP